MSDSEEIGVNITYLPSTQTQQLYSGLQIPLLAIKNSNQAWIIRKMK